ncbi:MAG: PemK family transcriptional regulator [Gracilibacter sp. BRH_c7a]|nr:MAG: PemK family transcriptional regulator [Gracilibacter sp. BRH_c7a]
MSIRRGEIFYAELNPVIGSEQGGTRPVLVIQNDIGNQYSPTTIVVAITSQISKAKLPTHVEVKSKRSGLERDSVILTEQIRTIDKSRLKEKVAVLDEEVMLRVDEAIEVSLGLTEI